MIYEQELCDKIIGCAIEVHRTLGSGYMEKLYEKALLIELKLSGLKAKAQMPVNVHYRGQLIGEYFADIVAENKVILELKACNSISPAHEAQLIQYLCASGFKVGYILNFANPGKLAFSRKVV